MKWRSGSDIAPGTEGALLPALLLQPVVENAVRHGLAPRAGAGELAVRAEKQGDRLLLQVQDNGRGAADTAARGIGLRNLESRLATLYGPDYALAVESAPACGYCLRLAGDGFGDGFAGVDVDYEDSHIGSR